MSATWPVGQAVGWTGAGWARMADAGWAGAIRPWHGRIVVRWGEERDEAEEVPALDRPVRIPSTGRTVTLRALFAALRANGVSPHPRGEAADEEAALGMVALGESMELGAHLETQIQGVPFFGVAEGAYARSAPASPEGQAALAALHETHPLVPFQGDVIAATGTAAEMLRDVARMGAGRVRRVKQSDVYYGAVFPDLELAGEFFLYGLTVPPPDELLASMEADGFGRLAATTELILTCLCAGVKLDLTPFNAGGGMALNHVAGGSEGDGVDPRTGERVDADYVPRSDGAGTLLWSTLRPGAPTWQTGFLMQSSSGWDSFYWEHGSAQESTGGSDDQRAHQQYVLNVWPTSTDAPAPTAGDYDEYMRECARRKALAVAAFAWGIGEWLTQIDLSVSACAAGTIGDVVETIELSNELDSFWPMPALGAAALSTDELRGAHEAGRFMALLAGPIQAQVVGMRFRHELASWSPVDDGAGGKTSNLPPKLLWLRAAIASFHDEVQWWHQVSGGRARVLAGEHVSPAVDKWVASEQLAGFSWPRDPARFPVPAPGALLQEVGLHCYHGYNSAPDGSALVQGYADSVQLATDMAALAAAAAVPGFRLSLSVGEIGFPAIEPVQGPEATSWDHYYVGASEKLQGAMYLRGLATFLACGVRASCIYTFSYGSAPTEASWDTSPVPLNGLSAFTATGLHNDILYGYVSGDEYLQEVDCWPRPSWFSVRRLAWLVHRLGLFASAWVRLVYNERGVTVVELLPAIPLDTGPDGAALAFPWTRVYLAWYDQYASNLVLHPHPADRRTSNVTLEFRHGGEFGGREPPSPGFELLPVVPEVVGPPVTSADTRGFAVPAGVEWRWPGWDGAKVGESFLTELRVFDRDLGPGFEAQTYVARLWIELQPCNPTAGVALAPLCILTTLEFVGVA